MKRSKGGSMFTCFRAVALGLIFTTCALAQFTTRSSLSGLVTDPTGGGIPNASVELADLDRNQTHMTVANDTGLYAFSNLTPGRYRVTAGAQGFSKTASGVITVTAEQNLRIDLAVQVGQLSETIEVKGGAPLLQTEQSLVGQTIERSLIEALPIRGRNFTNLTALAPNISTFPRNNTTANTFSVGANQVVAGTDYAAGGGGDIGFYVNGLNTTDNYRGMASFAPSTEAIEEVKVDVANFSAVNGRDISLTSLTTRGGASLYHGSAFETFQNSAFNAWNPFAKALSAPGQKKSLLQRSQYGGSLGGPILIPKLLKGRDKAFFFVAYERLANNLGGADAIFRVPTPEERQGDFSALLRRFPGDPNFVLWNPFSTVIDASGNSSRTAIPNNDLRNVVGPNGLGVRKEVQDMLSVFPLPNGYVNPTNPGDLRNYRTFASDGSRSWRVDTRFDYRLSQNDNIYVSFSKSHGVGRARGGLIPELTGNRDDYGYLVTANYARVFTPSLTNEFIFGIGSGEYYNVDQPVRDYLGRQDTVRNKYFKNIGTAEDFGFHRVTLSGNSWSNFGFNQVFRNINPSLQFSDNVSWIRGAHSWKFGMSFLTKREADWNYQREVLFNNTLTRGGSLNGPRGGDAVASFLLGLPTSMLQRSVLQGQSDILYSVDRKLPYWGFFAEDKWQISPKLTLSLGLRYDLPLPPFSNQPGRDATVDFSVPGWQLAIAGIAPNVARRYIPADKNNFAPRLSIAYRPKPELVLRASYGIFYMSGFLSFFGARSGEVPDYIDSYTNARFNVNDAIPNFKFEDIFPTPLNFAAGQYPVSTGTGTGWFASRRSVEFRDAKSNVTPYYQRYLLEVQKGLGPNSSVTWTYLGGRGVKLPNLENLNQPAYRTGWASDNIFNQARPNNLGRFSDVSVLRHGLNSFYNSASVRFQRNLSKGLQFVSHYTFSKTVQDAQYFQPETYRFSGSVWNWNRRFGRGEAEFSHPHRFLFAGGYQSTWGAALPPLLKGFVHGWNVNLVTTFESGNAFRVFNGITSARDFEPDLPNVSRNPNLPRGQRTFTRYFDIEAFSAPPQDVKGNAGANILRGPGINNWDISVSKIFNLRERTKIEFRGELFNAFNHTQWASIDRDFNTGQASTFGRVTGARDPRVVQFGLRVSF